MEFPPGGVSLRVSWSDGRKSGGHWSLLTQRYSPAKRAWTPLSPEEDAWRSSNRRPSCHHSPSSKRCRFSCGRGFGFHFRGRFGFHWLGLRWLGFGGLGFRLGRGATGIAAIFFSGLLVALAPVIRDVESRSLENQSGPSAKKSLHFSLTPSLHLAGGFRAGLEGFILHRLESLKGLPAFFTFKVVVRHVGPEATNNLTDSATGSDAINFCFITARAAVGFAHAPQRSSSVS